MIDKFRNDYLTAVKENEARKEEEEKKNRREMAKIASQAAKERKLKREPLSTTVMLEDESEDVIETMLETLQSGGGNQVKLKIKSSNLYAKICGPHMQSKLEFQPRRFLVHFDRN